MSTNEKVSEALPDVLRRRYRDLRAERYNDEFCRVFKRAADHIEELERRASRAPADVAGLVESLHDEADLCRNETADDIAALLDEAAAALRGLQKERDAMREALQAAAASDGGCSYSSEDDSVGHHACCGSMSYEPHERHCWVHKARAALAQREGK